MAVLPEEPRQPEEAGKQKFSNTNADPCTWGGIILRQLYTGNRLAGKQLFRKECASPCGQKNWL